MAAFQKDDLHLSMSPILLKIFFSGASSSVEADRCVLDRMQLIWHITGKPEVLTTPILTFPSYAIAKGDLVSEMAFAIDCDIERLKLEYDRDDKVLEDPANDHMSCKDLNITNPYIVDGISSVDTVYRLTMDDRKTYDLFIMRDYLREHGSRQIENDVRKAFQEPDKSPQKIAVLFQPRSRNCL